MTEPRIIKAHAWRIRGSLPKNDAAGRRWASNVQLTVMAPTAAEAIACTLEVHPDVAIYGVNHLGNGELLIISKLAEGA